MKVLSTPSFKRKLSLMRYSVQRQTFSFIARIEKLPDNKVTDLLSMDHVVDGDVRVHRIGPTSRIFYSIASSKNENFIMLLDFAQEHTHNYQRYRERTNYLKHRSRFKIK